MKKINVRFLKKSLSVLVAVSTLTTMLPSFSASAAGNLAYSVGCNYSYGQHDDIDTSRDALKSCDYYALAGYTSRYSCNPSTTKLQQSFHGTKLMESDIIMLSGHGNAGGIYFNSEGQGGIFEFWVTNNQSANGCIIVQNYNMNNVKLFIFDGCETAAGNTNVARTVVNRGAKAGLGWTVSVGVDCMYEWKNKFNNCIALGYTIQAAINYANSFNYGDNTCKNYRLYGNGDLVLKHASSSSASELMTQMNYTATVKRPATKLRYDLIEDKTAIENVLKNTFSNYAFADLQLDVARQDGGRATVTAIEKVGEYCTDNAYVLFYEDGKITEIFDRTSSDNALSVQKAEQPFSVVSETDRQAAFASAAQKIDQTRFTISDQRARAFYERETGRRYYMVYTTVESSHGTHSVFSSRFDLG